MSAQTVYSFSTPIGQAGGIYDLAPYAVDAFCNEADNGAMKFGMGVVQGTLVGKGVDVPASGATADTFEGIVTNRRTTENAILGGVVLNKGCTVGIMRYGRIYGLLAANDEPAYGDKVYLVVSGNDAGCFSKTATDNVEIAGRFLGGAHDGIALIELFNQAQPSGE